MTIISNPFAFLFFHPLLFLTSSFSRDNRPEDEEVYGEYENIIIGERGSERGRGSTDELDLELDSVTGERTVSQSYALGGGSGTGTPFRTPLKVQVRTSSSGTGNF